MFHSKNSVTFNSSLIIAAILAGSSIGVQAQANSLQSHNLGSQIQAGVHLNTATTNNLMAGLSKNPADTAANNSPSAAEGVSLIIKLKEYKVYVYKGDKVIAKYPIAIGKKKWETPVGEWEVMEKIKNPGWTSFKDGSTIKSGKDSPLGERWIGFWTDGKDMIGFHGTSNLKSIGTAASHGCVRMYNKDVKALYQFVKVGTSVKVVEQ